uniref:energy transducer TonB n=1 Tax=Sphingomonas bacterium TaxID=1895847 RepID=UPI002620946E|nr:energy transducer TonB [Sphingomonas bacterium]
MIALMMLQAAPSMPPRWLNEDVVIAPENTPVDALRRGGHGVVSMLARVSADGRFAGCAVTETSGSKELDAASCALLEHKARFEAATDATGRHIDGAFLTGVSYTTARGQPSAVIDLALPVERTPPGYIKATRTAVEFDESGHVIRCVVRRPSGSMAADAAICRHIVAQVTIKPPLSASSEPAQAYRTIVATLAVSGAVEE